MKTTQNSAHTSEVLNDLIQINNDRISGYKKAITETKEGDLKSLFSKMESESQKIASALKGEVNKLGVKIAETDGTTASGKIYRTWMDVKATFTGDDRKSILAACEFGEDAAQKAYKDALADDELPTEIRSVIKNQQQQLKFAHDTIKSLRDRAN